MRPIPALVALLSAGTLVVAGCARPSVPDDPAGPGGSDELRAVFEERAEQVAAGWAASTASGAWHTGFVPLQELTVPPAAGFPSSGAKNAFGNGWYVLQTELPATRPADGTVTFADGSTLRVPLTSARDAYAAIDQGDPPPCPPAGSGQPPSTGPDSPDSAASADCTALTVLGARLGTTTLRTSRGEATVPAWRFTVQAMRDQVARVAVAPAAVARPPQLDLPEFPYHPGLATAQDLVGVDGAEVTFRLGVGACDTDITPLVYETAEAVLVAGTVRTSPGVCTDQLLLSPVTVTLQEPLGARVVLDGLHGMPLTIPSR